MRTFSCIPEQKSGDILLIYPDFSKNELGAASYPENHLGLNRLATYLDTKGYKVSVLNTTGMEQGTNGPEMLAEYLKEKSQNYNIIGFHVNSWNISHIVRTLQILQTQLKNRLILFGGPLPTAEPKKILELFKKMGFQKIGIVQGYGECKLEEIVKNKNEFASIDGIWTLNGDEISEGNLQRFTTEQMAGLPLLNPKFNTFYQQYYRPFVDGETKFPIDIIYSSQGLDVNHGCPFNCSYCSVHIYGHQISEYSPERSVDEIEKIAKETGFFMFTFTNSNLLFTRRQWIIDFCDEIIRRNMHHYLTWSGYHHPNTINLLSVEDLQLMKKAGCDQIVVGIQSVEPEILKLFNRHPNTYEILKQIKEKTAAADLELVIDYIRGVPGENVDTIEEFYNYCVTNNIELREFLLKIYPNTELQNKNLDLNGFQLVPITGDLAPELDSYAVVPLHDNPKNRVLTQKINNSNKEIRRHRKIRIGQQYLESQKHATELKKKLIPANNHIPEKVKKAMIMMIQSMLAPVSQQSPFVQINPQQMLKTLVLADENSPPMIKKMQEKLITELGQAKFDELKKKLSSI